MSNTIKRRAGVAALLLAAGALTACTFGKALLTKTQSRERFVATQTNPDVRYAPGSQEMAERVAKAIGRARRIVEQTHDAGFKQAPRVFVCHADCVSAFAPVGKEVAAVQFGDEIFISDEVVKQREQQRNMPMERFLTHELAHLLLYQRVGPVAYLRVPSWFREGLAVAVSNGAGAEACTPAEATSSLLAGKHFNPAEAGSLLADQTASSYGLRPPVFYRQAGMFVQYLREQNPSAFQSALKDVLNGQDFQQSFSRAYGRPIASQWPGFTALMSQLVTRR